MLEERLCVQHVIDICRKASERLRLDQCDASNSRSRAKESRRLHVAWQTATKCLRTCQMQLANTATAIETSDSTLETYPREENCKGNSTGRRSLEQDCESYRRQLLFATESYQAYEEERKVVMERISAGKTALQAIAPEYEGSLIARDIHVADGGFQFLGPARNDALQQATRHHATMIASTRQRDGEHSERQANSPYGEQTTDLQTSLCLQSRHDPRIHKFPIAVSDGEASKLASEGQKKVTVPWSLAKLWRHRK